MCWLPALFSTVRVLKLSSHGEPTSVSNIWLLLEAPCAINDVVMQTKSWMHKSYFFENKCDKSLVLWSGPRYTNFKAKLKYTYTVVTPRALNACPAFFITDKVKTVQCGSKPACIKTATRRHRCTWNTTLHSSILWAKTTMIMRHTVMGDSGLFWQPGVI